MKNFRFEGDKRTMIYKLLRKWHKTLCELESIMHPWELPYVHKERPNVGVLAAAASRIGCLPFEEYKAQKGHGKEKWLGRADLWLARNSKRSYDFEAKYMKANIKGKSFNWRIKKKLDSACKDAINITYPSDKRIGIVFVRLEGASKDFNPTKIWTQMEDLRLYNADFGAMHICETKIWSTSDYHKDCPGIAIIGRYL